MVKALAASAFAGTGAEIQNAVGTCCKEEAEEEGVQEIRERIRSTVHKQVHSSEFKALWRSALGRDLAKVTPQHFRNFPAEDSEWRLFFCAYNTMMKVCDRELLNRKSLPKPNGHQKPPWWAVSEVARVPHHRTRPPASAIFQKCLSGPRSILYLFILASVLSILLVRKSWELNVAIDRVASGQRESAQLRAQIAGNWSVLQPHAKKQLPGERPDYHQLQMEVDKLRLQLSGKEWEMKQLKQSPGLARCIGDSNSSGMSVCPGLQPDAASSWAACRYTCCLDVSCLVWQFNEDGCRLGVPSDHCRGPWLAKAGRLSR